MASVALPSSVSARCLARKLARRDTIFPVLALILKSFRTNPPDVRRAVPLYTSNREPKSLSNFFSGGKHLVLMVLFL